MTPQHAPDRHGDERATVCAAARLLAPQLVRHSVVEAQNLIIATARRLGVEPVDVACYVLWNGVLPDR